MKDDYPKVNVKKPPRFPKEVITYTVDSLSYAHRSIILNAGDVIGMANATRPCIGNQFAYPSKELQPDLKGRTR